MATRRSLLRTAAERSLTWLLLAALVLPLAIVAAHLTKPEYVATLSPQVVKPERGHAFLVKLPRPSLLYQLRSDAHWPYRPSALIVEENGKRLGPAHSVHAEIRKIGRGAYSHWRAFLYFSASDNSDPRVNGRVYSVRAPLFVNRALVSLLLATLAGSCLAFYVLWISGSRHRVLLAVRRALAHPLARGLAARLRLDERQTLFVARTAEICVVLAAIVWINWMFLGATEIRACLSPDSSSYLGFSLVRPPLYPAFVQLAHGLTGDIRWLIPLQLNAVLLSLVTLGAVVGRLSRSRLWGLGFTLLSFTLTPVLLLSYMILTEAFFTTFIVLHFAMAGLFIKTRAWHHAVLAGIFLAALILVRPAGYSLLLALPLLVWLLRGEPKKALIGVGAPVLISFVLVALFNFARYGTFDAQSYGGFTLLGHVTHLIEPGDGARSGPHAETVEEIAKRMAPITTTLRTRPFPDALWREKSQKYNELLYSHALPTINRDLQSQDPNLGGVELHKRSAEVSMAIALSIIRAHPWDYMRNVLANYYGMWQGFLLDYGTIRAHVRMCYANMRKMHPSGKAVFERFTDLGYLDDAATASRFETRASSKTVQA